MKDEVTTREQLIGHVLDDKYRIEKKLGQGGMGAVYLATHLGTTRPVALKVIAPQFMTNAEFVERFRREAEAAGRLRHPNVVNVTDFGFSTVGEEQVAYLVMEYLDGSSLGDMLKARGRLPLGYAVDIVEQTCLAIDKAHQQGIIHRDLKPDNVWLEPNGRGGYNVKVLDFGLAKLRDPVPPDRARAAAASVADTPAHLVAENDRTLPGQSVSVDFDTPTQIQPADAAEEAVTRIHEPRAGTDGRATGIIPETRLTKVGAVLGTPLYMSPEQCTGHPLDARTDIYSLGVIAYQMLTGETPYTGDMQTLILKHTQSPPPSLKERCRDLPASVAAVVMSALAKEPAGRPATAEAFATALRANAEGEQPMLDRANELYGKRRFIFRSLAVLVYLPCILLVEALSLLRGELFILSLPILLFASTLNTAACALVIQQMQRTEFNQVRLRSILASLIRQLPALMSAALWNGLGVLIGLLKLVVPGLRAYRDHSLYAPVVVVEEGRGRAALARSKALVTRLRYPTAAILTYDFLICSLTLACLLVGFFAIKDLIGEPTQFYTWGYLIPLGLTIAFVSPLMVSSSHPRYAIAFFLIYLRARQIGGEGPNETLNQGVEWKDLPGRPKVSYRRTAGLLAFLLFKQVISYLVLVVLAFITIPFFILAFIQDDLVTTARVSSVKAVREALDRGADINAKDQFGFTALMAAAQFNRTNIMKLLLERGADVNTQGPNGLTALMLASQSDNPEAARVLLDHGADVNVAGGGGKSALMIAAEVGGKDIVKALLASGANASLRDNADKTALRYAVEKEHTEIGELLKAAGAVE